MSEYVTLEDWKTGGAREGEKKRQRPGEEGTTSITAAIWASRGL